MKTWCDNVKWRLDPKTPQRYVDADHTLEQAVRAAGKGEIVTETMIGGYMYLRSLMGPKAPLQLLRPAQLIHDCMKTWLELSDAIIAYTRSS